MFDTMTLTKASAGILGGLLFFMLGGMAADSLYSIGGGHGAHGEEHAMGYHIETGGDDHAQEVAAEPVVPFAEVYATADAAAGEGKWRACRSCHKLEAGVNGVGPSLFGVVDRAQGAIEGFGYSDTLLALGGTWTPENLSAFLTDPQAYAPGTKMNYKGMDDAEDRANLIAYLATFN